MGNLLSSARTALHSGLCISGQTIKECTRTLKKVQVLSNRLVIMLGAEDIYRVSCQPRKQFTLYRY